MAMETRYAHRGPGVSLPPISTENSFMRSKAQRLSPPPSSSPMAMSIPNSGNYDEPPPPLPPPPFVPVDGPTVFDPRPRDPDDGFLSEERDGFRSRDRSYRTEFDEGYHSIGSARLVPFCPIIAVDNCAGLGRRQLPTSCQIGYLTDYTSLAGRLALLSSACAAPTPFAPAPMLTTALCWTSSTPGDQSIAVLPPSGLLLAPLQGTTVTARPRCSFRSSSHYRSEQDYTNPYSTRPIATARRLWRLRHLRVVICSDMVLRKPVTTGRHCLRRAATLSNLATRGQGGTTAGR